MHCGNVQSTYTALYISLHVARHCSNNFKLICREIHYTNDIHCIINLSDKINISYKSLIGF